MPESVKVFLSTVSDEFGAYRDQLRTDLTRHNVEVKVQEDFKDLGRGILDELDVYIAHCDCVVHLAGDMTGSAPLKRDVDALLVKHPDLVADLPPLGEALRDGVDVSYTQWEAWLALYHRKPLLIAKAADKAERDPEYAPTDAARAAQAAHLARLKAMGRYPGCEFTSPDNLAKQIAYSVILDLLAKARAEGTPRRPKNLPFASLGSLFKGREQDLDKLHKALSADAGAATAIVGRALHGLGGIGKTRLAVEYALKHESEHSALLFLRADTPAALDTSLAALAGPDMLDLPEKDAREDAAKIAAALGWLAAHPGWLMIVDNVDDPAAVAAVDKLLARLSGGKVVVTGRAGNFPASLRKLELGVLDTPASVAFLLERTEDDRARSPDDAKLARELAGELGGLALGLEQAGAYIADRAHRLRALSQALAREARDRARLVRQDADELRPRHGPRRDLGDLGRPPDPGRPPPARTPRLSRAGADPRLAARRRRARRPRGLRRARGARQSLRLFARLARGGRSRQDGAGRFCRASAGAGFRAAEHDGGAARRGVAGGAGVGERGVWRRPARRPKLAAPRPARAACARGRQAGGRGGDRRTDGAAFQSTCCAVRSEGAIRRGRAALSPRAGDR